MLRYNAGKSDLIYETDDAIFKYINPEGNDKLSAMNNADLHDLLKLLDVYYFKLRSILGFDHNKTYGVEIEYEWDRKSTRNCSLTIEEELKRSGLYKKGWCTKPDVSIPMGGEIASPILRDDIISWKTLAKVCDIVSKHATIYRNAAAHAHIGVQALGGDKLSWLNFLYLWSVYENVIFRFLYGEYEKPRPTILRYAVPVAEKFYCLHEMAINNDYDSRRIVSYFFDDRYRAVNLENVNIRKMDTYSFGNTIEFRAANGTLNPAIWQNDINFYLCFLHYCYSLSYNRDIVDKRFIINNNMSCSFEDYEKVNLAQALELVDMIFTNNLDKINFLKQYLKSFNLKCNECGMPYSNFTADGVLRAKKSLATYVKKRINV